MERKSNSGTPFNQIITELEQINEILDYFIIGILRQYNIMELFEIAKEYQVDYNFTANLVDFIVMNNSN